jgi:hypothetical protein
MVELNKSNCNMCKKLFGPKSNIFCGDFLSDIKFTNTNNKSPLLFDCIIGNPPFQDNYGLSVAGKRINGGKSKLYERIFLKAYEMLNNGGFISFVVPDNIFSGNGSESYKILVNNYVSFVSFNPSNQEYFPGIQQTVCYFIMEKEKEKTISSSKKTKTTIEGSEGNTFQIVLEDRPVNPIRDWTVNTESLIRKYVSNDGAVVFYTLKDKKLYDNCVDKHTGLKDKSDLK